MTTKDYGVRINVDVLNEGKLEKHEQQLLALRRAQITYSNALRQYALTQRVATRAAVEAFQSESQQLRFKAQLVRAIEAERRAEDGLRRSRVQKVLQLAELARLQGNSERAERALLRTQQLSNLTARERVQIQRALNQIVAQGARETREAARAEERHRREAEQAKRALDAQRRAEDTLRRSRVQKVLQLAELARLQGNASRAEAVLLRTMQRSNLTVRERVQIQRALNSITAENSRQSREAARAEERRRREIERTNRAMQTQRTLSNQLFRAFVNFTRITASIFLFLFALRQITDAVRALLRPLQVIVKFGAEANDEFRKLQASLVGVVGSLRAVRDLQSDVFRASAGLPVTGLEALQATRGLAFIPATARSIQDPDGREERLNDLLKIVTSLATIDPVQGVQGAIFSLREALAGEFRSLRFRFELSPTAIARTIGKDLTDLKADPQLVIDALRTFTESFVGPEALNALRELLSKQGNLFRGVLQEFANLVGDQGIYDRATRTLAGINDTFTAALRGGQLNDAARKISISLDNLFSTILGAGGRALSSLSGRRIDLERLRGGDAEAIADVAAEVVDALSGFADRVVLITESLAIRLAPLLGFTGFDDASLRAELARVKEQIATREEQTQNLFTADAAGAFLIRRSGLGKLLNFLPTGQEKSFSEALADADSISGAIGGEIFGTVRGTSLESLRRREDLLSRFLNERGGGGPAGDPLVEQLKAVQQIANAGSQSFLNVPEIEDLDITAAKFGTISSIVNRQFGPGGELETAAAELERSLETTNDPRAQRIRDSLRTTIDVATGVVADRVAGTVQAALGEIDQAPAQQGVRQIRGILDPIIAALSERTPDLRPTQIDVRQLRGGAFGGLGLDQLPTSGVLDITQIASQVAGSLPEALDKAKDSPFFDASAIAKLREEYDLYLDVLRKVLDEQKALSTDPGQIETFTVLIERLDDAKSKIVEVEEAEEAFNRGLEDFSNALSIDELQISKRTRAADLRQIELDTAERILAVSELENATIAEKGRLVGRILDLKRALSDEVDAIADREIRDFQTQLDVAEAQANGNNRLLDTLQREVETRSLLLELESLQLESAEARAALEGQIAAIGAAKEKAAREGLFRSQDDFVEGLRRDEFRAAGQDKEAAALDIELERRQRLERLGNLDFGTIEQVELAAQINRIADLQIAKLNEVGDTFDALRQRVGDSFLDIITAAESAFSDTLVDIMDGTANEIDDIVSSLAKSIQRAFADVLAFIAIRAPLQNFLAGIFPGVVPGVNTSATGAGVSSTQLGGPTLASATGLGGVAAGRLFPHGVHVINAAAGVLTRPNTIIESNGQYVRTVEQGVPEAVVPLGGGGIPVRFLGDTRSRDRGEQPLTIVNVFEPEAVVRRAVAGDPSIVVNPVLADLNARGPTVRATRKVIRK